MLYCQTSVEVVLAARESNKKLSAWARSWTPWEQKLEMDKITAITARIQQTKDEESVIFPNLIGPNLQYASSLQEFEVEDEEVHGSSSVSSSEASGSSSSSSSEDSDSEKGSVYSQAESEQNDKGRKRSRRNAAAAKPVASGTQSILTRRGGLKNAV